MTKIKPSDADIVALAERAKIVAWLRKHTADLAADEDWEFILRMTTDAIERGEYVEVRR